MITNKKIKIKKFELSKAVFPNSFTALNAFCGFTSMILSARGDFQWAIYFIGFAAIFDALDGLIARLVKTSSPFGVELDSLSDVVSFGAAPSFLLYSVYMNELGTIGIILSSFLLIFGAFRLARFNIQLEDIEIKADFKGLPIPMAALTLATYIYTFSNGVTLPEPYGYISIPLIVLLAILMVSQIKYDAMPKPEPGNLQKNIIYFGGWIAILAAIYITRGSALFFIFIFIVLFGILRSLYYKLFNGASADEEEISEEIN